MNLDSGSELSEPEACPGGDRDEYGREQLKEPEWQIPVHAGHPADASIEEELVRDIPAYAGHSADASNREERVQDFPAYAGHSAAAAWVTYQWTVN